MHFKLPKTRSIPLFVSLLAIALAAPLHGAGYLKIGDIKGESQAAGHVDEIEILSWSFGMSNPVDFSTGGGGGAGKVSMQDISFAKELDKSSPKLMLACATGQAIPEAVFEQTRDSAEVPDRKVAPYLRITLTNVRVSSSSVSGATDGGQRPFESVTLNFEKIKIEYYPQREDGTYDAAVEFSWDLVNNQPAK